MNKLNSALLFLTLHLLATGVYAQNDSTSKRITVGIEQDALPYVLNGFIGTAWMGINHIRVRTSYAEANTPAFVLQNGFKQDRTRAFGISGEHFFKDDFRGLWLGPGIGYWNNEVISSNNYTDWVKSWVFSIGGGYNIFLWKGWYITPWLALHTRIIGNDSRTIDNTKYTPMLFTPEVSIKLGYKF